MMRTNEELRELQALPLDLKIKKTLLRIKEWHNHWGGNVYVSFSGGKDSTVLLHLVRSIYPEVPAVFCDTGLEFPEVRKHALSFPNVTVLKPKLNFRQVIEKYGWVYPSKDIAHNIYYARRGSNWAVKAMQGLNKDGTESDWKKSNYCRWRHLLDAPFKISDNCCFFMKKQPMDKYLKETGRYPIIGTMAAESTRRKLCWLQHGCNSYESKPPSCKPLSFWTEQDVLHYIKSNNIQIAEVYGEIVERNGKMETTGEKRTGCMFCLIGCHLDKTNRFQRMKETHPALYKYCMNELKMDEILSYLGVEH